MNSHVISTDDTLSSIFEIEQLLEYLKDTEQDIHYLQDLKRHRAKSVDSQISVLNEKRETYRQVILSTMKQHEPTKKTIPFPGVGKVSRRKVAGSWSVDNEDLMLEYFDREGIKDDIVEQPKPVINRRKLKAALDLLGKQNKNVPGVSREPDKEGVSISFESEDAVNSKPGIVLPDGSTKNMASLAV